MVRRPPSYHQLVFLQHVVTGILPLSGQRLERSQLSSTACAERLFYGTLCKTEISLDFQVYLLTHLFGRFYPRGATKLWQRSEYRHWEGIYMQHLPRDREEAIGKFVKNESWVVRPLQLSKAFRALHMRAVLKFGYVGKWVLLRNLCSWC